MTTDGIKLPAVVLAGAPATPEMVEKYSIEYRSDLPLAGKTMLRRVVDALAASRSVGDVAIVGNTVCEGASRNIPAAETLMENLLNGVAACAPDSPNGRVMVVTSDIPLLTPAAVDDFVERCGDLTADFYYAIVSKKANDSRFPGMRRTYVQLKEGTYTGGNLMVVSGEFLAANGGRIREMLDARKSPVKLAGLVGFGVLCRAIAAQTFWPGALDVPMLEQTVGRIFGGKLAAIDTPYTELGADVDTAELVAFAEAARANLDA